MMDIMLYINETAENLTKEETSIPIIISLGIDVSC